MNRFTVDASFFIKCFVQEIHSDTVLAFLSQGHELIVPDLFFTEITNVLWKKVQRHQMETDDVQYALELLLQMDFIVLPTKPLVDLALEISLHHGCSAYDATYLAAAIESSSFLVTADRRFYNMLKNSAYAPHLLWVENVV
jgi:predicted nucleic acid-binding protein